MNPELLDIQPRELKFVFELKKQSVCSVQLVNNSDKYVAFKVKTTSPKRYCVRPNVGIINPKSTCDFTVTMQAQRVAPPDMQCKDKFLVQSTIVPFDTTEEDITASMFTKENDKYVEEKKMKVILVSPPHSPVLVPINGALKQESSHESLTSDDQFFNGVENLPSPHTVANDVEELNSAKNVYELKPDQVVELKLAKDVEELKSKLNELELKLTEAGTTITKLTEERRRSIQERETLQQDLVVLRKSSNVRDVQVGFPFLFVCMVALISVALGYLLRP